MNKILDEQFEDKLNPYTEFGQNNGIKSEPSDKIKYNEAPCEKVIKGNNNSYIVFGRDRHSSWSSGYGGRGHDKCSAIDIVVGRVSKYDGNKITGFVNPSIGADAARIYISQKADIDDYYKLAPGRTGSSKANSAIVLKADDVRIVSRNTFKIVTGTDLQLSNGDASLLQTGVQLIANNEDGFLQPIPKGDNLVMAFKELIKRVNDLNGMMKSFYEIQKKFNEMISNHTHYSPFYGLITSPSEDAVKANIDAALQMYLKIEQGTNLFTSNLFAFENKFLTSGKDYINSSYHFLN